MNQNTNEKNLKSEVAVVTGANRGLGRATAIALAQKGIETIFASRNPHQGVHSLDALMQDLTAKGLRVRAVVLDLTDQASIAGFADRAKIQALDILVNNAGIFTREINPNLATNESVALADADKVLEIINNNTVGTLRLTQTLYPHLKKSFHPRIVNVSSGMGGIAEMAGGYPGYRLSKASLNALTRIMANEWKEFRINAVCPGWVKTDMGGPNAHREIDQGISGIVWAATLGKDGPSGGFFRDGKPIAW